MIKILNHTLSNNNVHNKKKKNNFYYMCIPSYTSSKYILGIVTYWEINVFKIKSLPKTMLFYHVLS